MQWNQRGQHCRHFEDLHQPGEFPCPGDESICGKVFTSRNKMSSHYSRYSIYLPSKEISVNLSLFQELQPKQPCRGAGNCQKACFSGLKIVICVFGWPQERYETFWLRKLAIVKASIWTIDISLSSWTVHVMQVGEGELFCVALMSKWPNVSLVDRFRIDWHPTCICLSCAGVNKTVSNQCEDWLHLLPSRVFQKSAHWQMLLVHASSAEIYLWWMTFSDYNMSNVGLFWNSENF